MVDSFWTLLTMCLLCVRCRFHWTFELPYSTIIRWRWWCRSTRLYRSLPQVFVGIRKNHYKCTIERYVANIIFVSNCCNLSSDNLSPITMDELLTSCTLVFNIRSDTKKRSTWIWSIPRGSHRINFQQCLIQVPELAHVGPHQSTDRSKRLVFDEMCTLMDSHLSSEYWYDCSNIVTTLIRSFDDSYNRPNQLYNYYQWCRCSLATRTTLVWKQ